MRIFIEHPWSDFGIHVKVSGEVLEEISRGISNGISERTTGWVSHEIPGKSSKEGRFGEKKNPKKTLEESLQESMEGSKWDSLDEIQTELRIPWKNFLKKFWKIF